MHRCRSQHACDDQNDGPIIDTPTVAINSIGASLSFTSPRRPASRKVEHQRITLATSRTDAAHDLDAPHLEHTVFAADDSWLVKPSRCSGSATPSNGVQRQRPESYHSVAPFTTTSQRTDRRTAPINPSLPRDATPSPVPTGAGHCGRSMSADQINIGGSQCRPARSMRGSSLHRYHGRRSPLWRQGRRQSQD